MEVASFAEIEEEFIKRVHSVVWCNVATIDIQDRPRSRILHPIWESSIGWITTRRGSAKEQHLARNVYVSLAYIADTTKPVYADCKAEWMENLVDKKRIWNKLHDAPPPLGFDPALFYERVDHPNFGLLKLTPWRIEIATQGVGTQVWHANRG
ncbi:MAG: pyridoxamine 5'-phosphate oxidase family protein [Chloroflexota bacterium]